MLKVWLPLNEDLHNQGLSDVTVTNNGATVNNSGKIGKCYEFDGNAHWLQFDQPLGDLYNNDYTIAVWLKPMDSTRSIIFSEYAASGASGVALELTASRGIRVYWNGSPDIYVPGPLPLDTWSHIAVVKTDGKIDFYVNGSLTYTYTGTLSNRVSNAAPRLGDDYRGGTSVSYKGCMNDFRLYSHALSTKEVKELSKGLVLHYPLNRGGFGADNLMKNTEVSSSNQTAISMTNSTEIVTEDGYLCYKVTNANTAGHFYGVGVTLSANTTYTYSAWIKCNHNANLNFTSLGHFSVINNASTASDKTHEDVVAQRIYRPSSVIANEWTKISITFTTNALDGSTFGVYPKYSLGPTHELFIRDMKLELGDTPTHWLPNSADTLYFSMGLDDNIEYDVSGYQNNGTVTGSLTYSSDTPRYMVSTVFDSGMNIESVNPLATCSEFTITGWINLTTGYAINNGFYLMGFDGTYCRICISKDSKAVRILLTNGTTNYMGGSTMEASSLVAGEWNHYAVTFDNGSIKVYINGVLDSTATATITSITFPSNHIRIGGYGIEQPKGKTSDIRFYATALSADDILALYNTPASIASNGTLLAQGEISEV